MSITLPNRIFSFSLTKYVENFYKQFWCLRNRFMMYNFHRKLNLRPKIDLQLPIQKVPFENAITIRHVRYRVGWLKNFTDLVSVRAGKTRGSGFKTLSGVKPCIRKWAHFAGIILVFNFLSRLHQYTSPQLPRESSLLHERTPSPRPTPHSSRRNLVRVTSSSGLGVPIMCSWFVCQWRQEPINLPLLLPLDCYRILRARKRLAIF